MYKTDNERIGRHLSDLIRKSPYKNDRQFGIAYLNLRDNGKVNPDDIQKMQNRICQIKKGNKGIQIEDLPIFSELLGVSAEDILSAGTCLAPVSSRKTNYSIAFSKDPADWKKYIEREDKPFLNPDEFNKTVIDYALEAGNFKFLKYLMDEGYIWFVGNDKKEYYIGFGAGTSVKRRELYFDVLDSRLKEQDDLRFRMISLAIENKAFEMLDTLKARELPLLYTINPVQHWTLRDTKLDLTPNISSMIESIAVSENTALSYFFDEFETEAESNALKSTFIFPYAGQVLDLLIKNHRTAESKRFLEKSIEYNKKVQKHLQSLVDKSKESCRELYKDSKSEYYDEAYFRREAWREYYFYPDTGFIAYYMPFYSKNTTGFITNVINVTASSGDSEVQFLIDELKRTYNTFIKQFENKEA